mmetsp:Transcript_91428/g.267488  ORF Transcript_91428/g.267488 Transcript_91428/m.267488 type:complete len:206 (+) Transcript_91428:839-1456(+)
MPGPCELAGHHAVARGQAPAHARHPPADGGPAGRQGARPRHPRRPPGRALRRGASPAKDRYSTHRPGVRLLDDVEAEHRGGEEGEGGVGPEAGSEAPGGRGEVRRHAGAPSRAPTEDVARQHGGRQAAGADGDHQGRLPKPDDDPGHQRGLLEAHPSRVLEADRARRGLHGAGAAAAVKRGKLPEQPVLRGLRPGARGSAAGGRG